MARHLLKSPFRLSNPPLAEERFPPATQQLAQCRTVTNSPCLFDTLHKHLLRLLEPSLLEEQYSSSPEESAFNVTLCELSGKGQAFLQVRFCLRIVPLTGSGEPQSQQEGADAVAVSHLPGRRQSFQSVRIRLFVFPLLISHLP